MFSNAIIPNKNPQPCGFMVVGNIQYLWNFKTGFSVILNYNALHISDEDKDTYGFMFSNTGVENEN